MMAAIKAKDSKPEMIIRRSLHGRGFRYRLHATHLPGKPDLVFPALRAAIFVHGCFWHAHRCPAFRLPSTRQEFWSGKLAANEARDARCVSALTASGWRVLVIWECALTGPARLGVDEVIHAAGKWLREGTENVELRGRV